MAPVLERLRVGDHPRTMEKLGKPQEIIKFSADLTKMFLSPYYDKYGDLRDKGGWVPNKIDPPDVIEKVVSERQQKRREYNRSYQRLYRKTITFKTAQQRPYTKEKKQRYISEWRARKAETTEGQAYLERLRQSNLASAKRSKLARKSGAVSLPSEYTPTTLKALRIRITELVGDSNHTGVSSLYYKNVHDSPERLLFKRLDHGFLKPEISGLNKLIIISQKEYGFMFPTPKVEKVKRHVGRPSNYELGLPLTVGWYWFDSFCDKMRELGYPKVTDKNRWHNTSLLKDAVVLPCMSKDSPAYDPTSLRCIQKLSFFAY